MIRTSWGRGTLLVAVAAAAVSLVGLPGCSSGGAVEVGATSGGQASAPVGQVRTLRLGFFPNITHAPALVGLQEGLFRSSLRELGVAVTPTAFNAGPDAVSALFGGSLDIAYIGPNPTINAYAQSRGEAVRVIAGAASGGAALVVRPGIDSASDLKGRRIATPQLGNTQDVALRHWLAGQGLASDTEGGGDVSILPQANAEGLAAYSTGQLDGAWVPEPWVSEYRRAGARVLVDEATLWPEGKFVTTDVVVRSRFLAEHPDVVEAFLAGHVAALAAIEEDPQAAARSANVSLKSLTGSSLAPDVLARAFSGIEFTADPLPETLQQSADHAAEVGLLELSQVRTAGGLPGALFDLTLLNKALAGAGRPQVAAP